MKLTALQLHYWQSRLGLKISRDKEQATGCAGDQSPRPGVRGSVPRRHTEAQSALHLLLEGGGDAPFPNQVLAFAETLAHDEWRCPNSRGVIDPGSLARALSLPPVSRPLVSVWVWQGVRPPK